MSHSSSTIALDASGSIAGATVHVSHRTLDQARTLRPWIVHVFQGKPSHQTEDASATHDSPPPASASASSSGSLPVPSAAVSLSLPCTESTHAPIALPFATPTTKEAHEDHDVRVLSAAQAAFYANEYGKVEQQLELARVLDSLRYTDEDGCERRVCEKVVFHQVSISSVHALVRQLQHDQCELEQQYTSAPSKAQPFVPTIVVLNLCDGTEVDGYPGITIATALAHTLSSSDPALPPLAHTGADPAFFHTTTDKVTMKRLFAESKPKQVRSARFVDMTQISCEVPVVDETSDLTPHLALLDALKPLAYPLIIKPTTSYSSCGLSTSSVVHTPIEALKQAQLIRAQLGDVLAEEFVDGREFSMLIVGDANRRVGSNQEKDAVDATDAAASSSSSTSSSSSSTTSTVSTAFPHLRCYSAAERAFSSSLPPLQRFLTFEQNYPTKFTQVHTWWQRLEGGEQARREQEEMALLACQAYTACDGRSYGRIDIRQSSSTGEFFILEVNSLPGISGELDSSVGAILHHADPPTLFAEFVYAIVHLAAEGRLNPVTKVTTENSQSKDGGTGANSAN